MKAGAAQRDITPPVGILIDAPTRKNIGAHDPLFVRALVLDDGHDAAVAIVCTDLIGCRFDVAEQVQQAVEVATGIEHTVLNFAHQHSSRFLAPRGQGGESEAEIAWNNGAHDAIVETVGEAQAAAVPVTLRAGRAPAQVGFNRRIVLEGGQIHMGDNKEGPVVPWVNVLVAERSADGAPLGVLFEHAAHPVICSNTRRIR
ncbi:MAG: hypothetical protein ACYS8X_10705 [Planctomycetota bacterium]|jgi:hypothetical protein